MLKTFVSGHLLAFVGQKVLVAEIFGPAPIVGGQKMARIASRGAPCPHTPHSLPNPLNALHAQPAFGLHFKCTVGECTPFPARAMQPWHGEAGTAAIRVAKCHRYGRYICVKILEGWGKKCERPNSFV